MNSVSNQPNPQQSKVPSNSLSCHSWLARHPIEDPELPDIRRRKLEVILGIAVVGFAAAGVYYYWQAVYLCRTFPYNTFLSVPMARFSDYDNMIAMCATLNPYHTASHSGYPPLANLFFFLFSQFPAPFGFVVFVTLPLACFASIQYCLLQGFGLFNRLLTITLLFLSYPILFAIDRGNLDLWILALLAVFLAFYRASSKRKRDISALALAIAIALKVYPAPFLLLFLKDRRYVDLLKVAIFSILSTLVGAAALSGGSLAALRDFHAMLATTDNEVRGGLPYASSNLGLYYAAEIIATKMNFGELADFVTKYYSYFALGFLAFTTILISVAPMRLWASTTCIAAVTCLTPSLSNDYRLVLFLVPIVMFVNSSTKINRSYIGIAIIFALLLIPKNYLLFFPETGRGDIGIASVLNPILLILLVVVTLRAESKRLYPRYTSSVATAASLCTYAGLILSALVIVYLLQADALFSILFGAQNTQAATVRWFALISASSLHIYLLVRVVGKYRETVSFRSP